MVHFNVRAGDVIVWEFATRKRDVAFGVFFEATEVVTEYTLTMVCHKYHFILLLWHILRTLQPHDYCAHTFTNQVRVSLVIFQLFIW